MPRRRSPTTVGETLCPFFASSVTRLRKLRLVHNRGRIGSPLVAGATKLLRSTTRVGSSIVFLLRPPPSLRIRPGGADTLSRMSDSPRYIVDRAKPEISDIKLTPP